jgi:GT2 family glycosyltransferase
MYERKIPKASIIVPCWFKDGQDGKYGKDETFWFAWECISKLKERTPREDYELILIDNGSTLSGEIPNAEGGVTSFWEMGDVVIKNPSNLGFGPACNQGFGIARGEYIVCINNDILVWPGWLDALLNVFQQPLRPPVGMVMPALIPDLRDFREALKLENPNFSLHAGKYGAAAEFGSLWVMKKELMDEIKRKDGFVFDEKFLLGMGEDRDLYKRVRLFGLETYRCHDTRVFHIGNGTIGKVPDRKNFTTANREYLKEKWDIKD